MTTYVGDAHDQYPYSAVTYLEVEYPDGTLASGSGAVIGENDVLTASHVIYSDANGGLAEEITAYPGLDGYETPYGGYEWGNANYFEVDGDSTGMITQRESEYDVAVIGFEEPIGAQTGWFGIDDLADDGFFNLTGYPGVYADASGPRMTNDFGSVDLNAFNDVWDYGTIDSDRGNSGGPLWYSSNGMPHLVGVASTNGWAVDVFAQRDNISTWMEENDSLLEDNSPPEAVDDRATAVAGTAATIDVLANDREPDGDSLTLTNVSTPSNGQASITDNGQISYQADPGFTGTERFSYTVSDAAGAADTATVEVTVNAPAPDPVPDADVLEPAARVFLNSDATFTLADPAMVFGRSGGDEAVELTPGARGVRLDGNVETVTLPQALSSTTLQVRDGRLEVRGDSEPLITFTSGLNAAVTLQFTDGEGALTQTGAARFTLAGPGGEASIGDSPVTPQILDQTSPAGARVTAEVSVANDPVFTGLAGEIADAVQAGFEEWTRFLEVPEPVSATVAVNAVDSDALASGGSQYFPSDRLPDAGGVPSVLANKLMTGEDTNGAEADATINISRQNLDQFVFSGTVGPAQHSAERIMAHELGHALGFAGFFDEPDATLTTPWDTHLSQTANGIVFEGEHAVAANGGDPVPLDGVAHLSEEIFGPALMTPVAENGGGEAITAVEIGMIRDIGLPVAGDAETLLA